MSTRQPIRLTQDQIHQYHNDGYLIVHNLLADQEIAAFLEREARTRPPQGERGLLTHLEDPQWEYLAKHPNVAGVVAQLLDGMPRILQTMYMPKAPASDEKVGGAGIAFHQDTHYLPNEPNTLMACWIAMNDTDAENGGLCVVPGSHRGPLHSTRLNVDDSHVSWEMEYLMRDRNGREWKQKFYSFQIEGLEQQQIVVLTIPRGSGVFFSGMTIHGSYANRSRQRPRLAFAVHYVKDGTWVYRTDVQDTMPVTEFSTLIH
jgi:ectoine hydroxylase-related dioxygenase (phytanoyl-CoA dioxygenase family)